MLQIDLHWFCVPSVTITYHRIFVFWMNYTLKRNVYSTSKIQCVEWLFVEELHALEKALDIKSMFTELHNNQPWNTNEYCMLFRKHC